MTTTQPALRSARNRDIRRVLKGLAFCSPWIIGFIAFQVIPIVASLYFSFTNYSILQAPVWTGVDNYVQLLTSDGQFLTALGNTLYYTIGANLIGGTVALTLAMLLNMKVRGLSIYRTIFYVPVVVPIVASSIIWLYLLNPQIGVITIILRAVGIAPIPWLTDPGWAKPSLILMSLWSIGNAVVIFLAGLQDIPVELLEAAELDGASGFQQIMSIKIPMISSVVFFNLVIGLIGSFQVFSQAYVMTNGGPADSTLFYALYLYRSAFQYFKMGYASALAWILFVIIMGTSALVFRSTDRWVYYAGK
jgi:multiple sugar transport system permease protein